MQTLWDQDKQYEQKLWDLHNRKVRGSLVQVRLAWNCISKRSGDSGIRILNLRVSGKNPTKSIFFLRFARTPLQKFSGNSATLLYFWFPDGVNFLVADIVQGESKWMQNALDKEGRQSFVQGRLKPSELHQKLTKGGNKAWSERFTAKIKPECGGLCVLECKRCKAGLT